ncbi:MAG TPA: MerR family transcriptional regulator [Bacteroidales bacterium]|nr:MerR family transcriptional regulator [Bacteroidales bacterium]
MGAYTIRELENLSGIKAHTIRIWEKRYGLISPQRTSTNIRTYRDTELKKLLNISILNRNGLKISKIAQLSSDEIVSRINQYTHDITSTESQIENLTLAMIDLDERRFEQVLARAVIKFGFEEAVIRVLYPFFMRIGLMWQTDSINITQEHFISNLVRQKFFSAIDNLEMVEKPENKRFVFFLPEGELHEIGLLFYCYLVRKREYKTLYLGQSLPLKDLSDISKTFPYDFIVTSITASLNKKGAADYIRLLSEKFNDKTVYISGARVLDFSQEIPKNVKLISSPQSFLDEIEALHNA